MTAYTDKRAIATAPRGAGPAAALGRGLAVAVLVASILPVLFLGPALLRAPLKLAREWRVDVHRMLAPAQIDSRASSAATPAPAFVSLGAVYGRWSSFPQRGRDASSSVGEHATRRPGSSRRTRSTRSTGALRPKRSTRARGRGRR